MLRAFSLALALLTGACAGPLFEERDAMLWHRSGAFAIPDLVQSGPEPGGWARVELAGAELAFGTAGRSVIAVSSACAEDQRPPDVASRQLWLGLAQEDRERRRIRVAGLPAIETVGVSRGVRIQTVVLEAGGCTLDLAYAAPEDRARDAAFETFLLGLWVRSKP